LIPFDDEPPRFRAFKCLICFLIGHRLQRIREQVTQEHYFTESRCTRCHMVQILQSCDPLDLRRHQPRSTDFP